MHLHRLVLFHTQRYFRSRLSVRVSDSGHPAKYAIQLFTNNPSHKIYRCMPSRSTRHYTLPHNLTILHTDLFFAPACHPCNKISSEKNCHSIHWCTHARLTFHRILPKMWFKQKSESKHFPFSFFRVRVRFRVAFQSSTRLQWLFITPHDYMGCLLILFLRSLHVLSH